MFVPMSALVVKGAAIDLLKKPRLRSDMWSA